MKRIEMEMSRFNVTYFDIQRVIGRSEKTVRNKLCGATDFTYNETQRIRNMLFPGMSIEYLFDEITSDQTK